MRRSISSTKPMTPGMRFFFLRVFPFIFVVVGGGVGLFGVRGLIRAKESVDWPSVPGTVVASSVERHTSRSNGRSTTTYRAEIQYEFTVGDAVFTGERVAYGDYGSSDSSHASRVVKRYPVGKAVTVHHMPDQPTESVLEPGVQTQAYFLPGFGLLFFAVGGGMAIHLPRVANKTVRDVSENQSGQGHPPPVSHT